jgi:uncharacterized membrane protein YtjA (UPF0391 family)
MPRSDRRYAADLEGDDTLHELASVVSPSSGTASAPARSGIQRALAAHWALFSLLISIIAGLSGFTGISAAAAGIAKILFFVFIVVFVALLALALMAGRAIF